MDDLPTHTGLVMTGNHIGIAEYGGGASGMVVLFYNKSVHNPAKSLVEGHPIYEDRVYVRVHPPGERLNIVDRPATGTDAKKWPAQWHQFQSNKQQTSEGTPIGLLYPDHPSIASMMQANGVHTVEQCANLSGHAIDSIGMGAQKYVNDAAKYLEMANKGVKGSQLRKELEERDGQIRVLNKKVEELMATVHRLQTVNLNANMAQVQTLLAGAMERPQHMPAVAFDPQTAQINANHDMAAPRRPVRRQRPKLTG